MIQYKQASNQKVTKEDNGKKVQWWKGHKYCYNSHTVQNLPHCHYPA